MSWEKAPELLVHASCLEVLKVAVIYGADAVYIGGEAYGLRAKAKNFSMADMAEGIRFAHEHGVRVYVTANILAYNEDLEGVRAYFRELRELGPDGLIIADPGVFSIAEEICPEIPRHISTQANNTNYETCRFWHRLGASRIVTARELSLREIREIQENIPADMELETFVPIRGGACYPIILQAGMPTVGPVPIPAAGNMRWWRKQGPENTCRSLRMKGEPSCSIPRISA